MITSMLLHVVSSDKKKVKKVLAFFLCFVTCLCFLVNCRSIKGNEGSVSTVYQQPKYIASYWIQAQIYPVEGINWNQPYLFLPPLRLNETGQVAENYALSLAPKNNHRDNSLTFYAYSSDFTTRARGFSGFIDGLATFFDQSATEYYVYEMPDNLDRAMMIKYYYRIDDVMANTGETNNDIYRIFLIISIEWMQIVDEKIQLETVWKGEMVLNVSRSVDRMEAINLGYHQLSKYVLQEGSKKDRINLLNY